VHFVDTHRTQADADERFILVGVSRLIKAASRCLHVSPTEVKWHQELEAEQRLAISLRPLERRNVIVVSCVNSLQRVTQWRERTDLKECILSNCWNTFDIYTSQGSLLLLNQKKNIQIYFIQKRVK